MFEEVIEHNRRSHMKLMLTKSLSNPIVQTIAAVGLAGVLYMATVDAIDDRMTVGEFTSFIAALMLITAPLRRLVNVAGPLQQGIAAAQSIFEVLDTPVEDQGGGYRGARSRGEVEYRDVEFQYPTASEPVLHGVSFHARPGETIADRRPFRQRQVHAGGPAAALLRHVGRAGAARWPRRPGLCARCAARPDQPGEPGRRAVQRHHPQQHRLRLSGHGGRDRGRCAGGARHRVHRHPAARPRHAGRRSRRAAVRRPAAAHRHRACAAAEHADPDPRRGHLGARHRTRAPDPGRSSRR